MPRNFADRLLDEMDKKQNPSCAGLDPVIADIPSHIKRAAIEKFHVYDKDPSERRRALLEATGDAMFEFNRAIIDSVKGIVPVVKPQMAFYECYGPDGIIAFLRTVDYARQKGFIVIEDAKREDIGKTASFYANGHLGTVELIDGSRTSMFDVDAITISPYIGSDNVGEFAKVMLEFGKGGFVLDKTSNSSSGEIQDLRLAPEHGGRTIYEHMALLIDIWGEPLKGERGYKSLGAVVGATYPEQAVRCREMMENALILVPGYGSQGGTGKDTVPNFNDDGYGAVINNSGNLIFAYKREPYRTKFGPEKFAEATREEAQRMRVDILSSMQSAGKLPAGWTHV